MVSFFKAIFNGRPRCSDSYREICPRIMIRSGLVFRIPRCGFRVPGQLDSRCQWNLDYGFLQLNSGFTKFGIPDSISRNVPDSGFLKQRFLDSRIRISLHGGDSSCMQAVAIGLIFRTVPFCITGDFIWPTRSPEHFWRRIESRDSLGNHYFFKQCTELMFMWCTTPPLHNFSIFPNREIQRSFKHTVAFFFSIW